MPLKQVLKNLYYSNKYTINITTEAVKRLKSKLPEAIGLSKKSPNTTPNRRVKTVVPAIMVSQYKYGH